MVAEGAYVVPPGRSRVCRFGRDVTIVGVSNMVVEALRAAELLAEAGVSAEVIDPIWLAPLDSETIVESARRTRKVLIADNGWLNCGASAEIAARLAEALAGEGPIRIKRMGFAPTPCPPSPELENAFYPNPGTIAAAAYALAKPDAPAWTPDPARTKLAYQMQFKGPF
jgi:pyruvate dehydrogenase E1 component beta subunit